MRTLRRLHDASSAAGAAIAVACVAVTACIYTVEVAARYFFNAPLNWSGDISAYLLCAITFLALPQVTRTNGHIAIGYFVERMSERARARYARALSIVTGLACLAAASFVAIEGAELFARGVLTTQATRIPKWPIALLAGLGLLSAGLHFIFAPPARAGQEPGV